MLKEAVHLVLANTQCLKGRVLRSNPVLQTTFTIVYVQYQHFYNMWQISFTLHVYSMERLSMLEGGVSVLTPKLSSTAARSVALSFKQLSTSNNAYAKVGL